MRLDHLDDLHADALHRVERRQRILEDHRDLLAAGTAGDLGLGTDQLDAVEHWPIPMILALLGSRPIRPRNVTDLPEPDSPTTASSSPLLTDEVDAAHRLHLARQCGERDPEVIELQCNGHQARPPDALGSVASRRPSPMKLMHSVMMSSAVNGKTTSHQ